MNYDFYRVDLFRPFNWQLRLFWKKLVRRTLNVPRFVVPWTLYLVVYECNLCAILVYVFVDECDSSIVDREDLHCR